jgi:hypothetical protein
MASAQGDYARASALHEESLALGRELGDTGVVADTLINLGRVAFAQGDEGRAAALYAALALSGTLGDKWLSAFCLEGLVSVASVQGTRSARHGCSGRPTPCAPPSARPCLRLNGPPMMRPWRRHGRHWGMTPLTPSGPAPRPSWEAMVEEALAAFPG